MSTNSGIQWTTHTFNPWWGCLKVAQGCKNCYAEGVATRFHGRKVWGPNSDRKLASEKVWNDPMRWNRAAEAAAVPAKVFCLSMGDVLEDHPQLVEPRKRLVNIIENTPWLTWQLLTKRPENAAMFGWGSAWPGNVWFGTSAAIQAELDANLPHLFRAAAAVRFLSLEPLCGPMDLHDCFYRPRMGASDPYKRLQTIIPIQWVIVGGESGPGARPCDVAWIRGIVGQCKAAGVACFVKQLGACFHDAPNGIAGRGLDIAPEGMALLHYRLGDPKGGDWNEWADDLRVREFPGGAA